MSSERYQREGQPSGASGTASPVTRSAALPLPRLSVTDAIALIVGIVVGAGIFRTPSLVAANATGSGAVLLLWSIGGLVSLIGAMCYAELASTWPNAGGDYHFLRKALGDSLAFLFAWARLTVIPTGSIALLGFIFGDYASQLLPLGEHSSALYAALSVVVLTGLNVAGVQLGKWTQNLLTVMVVAGLLLVIVAGLFLSPGTPPAPVQSVAPEGPRHAAWGLAMVFVLLTYGGWNEAAYISSELRGGRRGIVSALLWSMVAVTGLYLLVNLAFLNGLGLARMGRSEAVAAELMQRVAGPSGALLISVLIAGAALTSSNATILMGSRTHYALGRDFPMFSLLGRWNERAGPVNALWVQGALSLVLVGVGALTRRGFETMVEYTAPVFWFFFLLTGVSLLVLRRREPHVERPFRVPLYPLTPLLFCATSAYLLYSSLAYTGLGALVGLAVLATGLLPLGLMKRREARRRRNPSPGGRTS